MAVDGERVAELGDDAVVHAQVEHGVDLLDRVDHARVADDEVLLERPS